MANFVPNFIAMATGVGREKCNRQHSMAHPRKPPYRCKNLAKISYTRRVIANFDPNFVAMATGVGRGKTQSAALDGPSPKIPQRREKSPKNLLCKPSYSPFSHKFRCHSNGGRSGKKCNRQHSMAHPRKPCYRRKNLAKISYTNGVIANFDPNFVAMATGVARGKMQCDGPSNAVNCIFS